jgi:hypothetical protein
MDLDSIDEKQAFKLGFAAYCADHNMSPEEATHFAEKSAWGDLAKTLAQGGLAAGIGIPLAAGMVGGGALGYGAAKFDEPEINPDDIKAKEIADTYKRYTERLKARRAYQQYRTARQMP